MKKGREIKGAGGKRKGSGRKSIDKDLKKKSVTLYVAPSDIDKMGGEDAFKEKCYDLLK